MAAILPTSVLFQIHQVVDAFQMINVMKEKPKNLFLFCVLSATNNKGINAMKIKNVSGDTGHDANNNTPDKILNPNS
jgi:hypothetical protein